MSLHIDNNYLNIDSKIHFFNQFFGAQETLKRTFPLKTEPQTSLRPQYFLYKT